MPAHVHARPEEAHTFVTQARAMAGESRNPIGMHDSMARYVGVVTRAHDVADRARGQRATGEHSDESVCRDAARRDPPYDAAHRSRPRVRDRSRISAYRDDLRHGLIMPNVAGHTGRT
jgi:hypothetical protein